MSTNKRHKLMMIALSLLLTVFFIPSALGSGDVYGATQKGVVKEGPLNVRTGAGTSYKVLGTLAKGKKVTIEGTKKDTDQVKWYKITFKSKTGYISSQFVKIDTSSNTVTKVNKQGKVNAGPLNVRSGPGTKHSILGTLKVGTELKVITKTKLKSGETWYKFNYTSSKKGYVLARYVTLQNSTTGTGLTEEQFEKWMTDQGFPQSYKPKLRALHKAHPKWIFVAEKTNLQWADVIKKESKIGINLVEPSSPAAWKSKEPGAYNSATGKYTTFDGRWNAASRDIISYHMDPRNFLNETSVYQFMEHSFNAKSQTKDTIKSLVSRNNCFMNTNSYINDLYNAGSKAKVSPNVIAAMVVMEQGWKGTSDLISGKHKKYPGIYNHFNIGAYTAGGMSATERGLWWANGMGVNDKSYGRPWNSIEKSLAGGAGFYGQNYLLKNQYTYYTKKFNVMNGLNKVATHQYMSNTVAAQSEGKILKFAYEKSDDYPGVFYIPVYENMPAKVCPKP